MKVYDLKTNYQVNPMGIELSHVTVSWKVSGAKGTKQACARVLVGHDEAFQELVFDSGDAQLNSCAYTPEASWKPGRRYYWKVMVTDDQGETGCSQTAWFEGGHPEEEWHGSWIQPPFVREIHPVFQKTFRVEEQEREQMAHSRLYICGLGVYEVYINGNKVGDEYLTPYFTDYRYWIQYQTYDVKEYLKAGDNEIRIFLGNGWYKGRFGYLNKGQLKEYYGDRFQLLADLYLTGADGSSRVIATDESWLVLKSTVISSGIYDGETYDARMEPALEAIPARQRLSAVLANPPKGMLSPMTGPGVKKQQVVKVREIIKTPIGETVLDFGQVLTGWVAFWAEGPEGQRIKLQYGEVLQNGLFYRDNLRTAQAEYTFVSNGKKQFVRPHFTFYGFRYVKVTGMEVDASNVDEFEAWVLYSDMEETGSIRTSHEKLNKLIENTRWSQKGNFLDIPTDCPQRDERLGWTGDAQIFSMAACYHMQTPAFFRKYMKDMLFEQREKGGAVPYVVPDVLTVGRRMNAEPEFDMADSAWGEAGSCVWGDAATIIPWNLYLHYGNKAWLLQQYDNMKLWVDFIIHMDEEHCNGERLWSCGFHFGDWLSLDSEGDSREGGTDKYFVASVSYMHSARLVSKAAAVLGRKEEDRYYKQIASEVRAAIRAKYIPGKGELSIQTQTAYVLGIWFDLFEEEEMQAAADRLYRLLEENGMHLATGFVGTAYLCHALAKAGYGEAAYTLLLNEEYPGWLYEVNLGATTIWERWNSLLPDGSISGTGMNSLNHYAYGSVVEWIYSRVCGLMVTEQEMGPKKMEFSPLPDNRLDFAQAEYRSVAGDYKAGWERKGSQVSYQVEVPFDCTVTFRPNQKFSRIKVNGTLTEAAGGKVELSAGVYEIELIDEPVNA